jgi:nicotinate-nucleotide adenylyltransferase
MRVAFFGGTFDPPHRGHVALARLARKRLSLDRVLVAPVATQPLKHENPPASFADRVAMARLAFADEPATEISLIDAPRPDGSSNYLPNYTIDTLATLRRQLTPEDTLFCILGADSFVTISNWHRSADLLLTCDFIVGARPGFDLEQAIAALLGGISAKPLPSELPHTRIIELQAPESAPEAHTSRASRLYLLMDLAEDISATRIRSALSGHSDPLQVLNPAVAEYIHTHHLYRHL